MRRTAPRLTALLLWIVLTLGFGHARLVLAAEQTIDGRTFTLPAGFVIERISGPPMVDRPITADFDEQGRLYVADSSGSNDKVAVQLAEKPHRIVRLEDTDGDGRFDRRTIFADRMMFPEGTMWYEGSLYVSAPPSIWKLTDTDDDGVADQRVEWFQGKTLTGCANDLHGPYFGPDGWIYWCKGAFAKQTYERPGQPPFVTRASHIFRARPDGTGIEPVMTGGMDNPVDVVFTPGGERIFSCTFLQHPGNGRRDGLIHAVYGGVYGKVHDVLDGHIRTSPDVLPVLSHLGPAAPCGLTAYESSAFGREYRDNLFACNFNLQKITRHVLKPDGATFRSEDSDFLVTSDRDFHPTDVIEDADGSLIVVDTGGWYKLCCPTSQLPKPDVLGAIYRVRKASAAKVDDPRGLTLHWSNADELVKRLDDPRPAVRRRAIATLAKLGLVPETEPSGRLNAVWTACRIDSPGARAFVRKALTDPDPTVRQAACHAVSLWRDQEAVPTLALLLTDSPLVRRAAVEAIGRAGDRSAALLLTSLLKESGDRFLEHSLTYALIELGNTKALEAILGTTKSSGQIASMIALDQLGRSDLLNPQLVASFLDSSKPSNREAASWVLSHHPEWAGALTASLRNRLAVNSLPDRDRDDQLADQLARFASSAQIQDLLAETLRDSRGSDRDVARRREIALRAMARSGLKSIPKRWVEGLTSLLEGHDSKGVVEAVATSRALTIRDPDLTAALTKIGGDVKAPPTLRLDALAAISAALGLVDAEVFGFLRDRLDRANPVAERTAAADVLSRAKLSAKQLSLLTGSVRSAGPLEIDKLLTAFEQTKEESIGLELVDALKASRALGALRVDRLKPRLDKFGPVVRARADELYAALNIDAATQKAKLEELLPTLQSGDVRRGQAVFNGTKAGCLSCHAVGYLGGKVGPDLSRIGQIRTERDLLESIVFPSLSFVRSYEPVTIATRAGQVVTGILKKDSADEIVLAVNATDEPHFRRDDVEEMRPGNVSIMPAGLDQQLTRQELADLIAFLKSRK